MVFLVKLLIIAKRTSSCKCPSIPFSLKDFTKYVHATMYILRLFLAAVLAFSTLVACTFTVRETSSNFGISPQPARRGNSQGVICPETKGSNVTLSSGNSTYILRVPADKMLHSTVGSSEELGCIGPLASKYSQCVPCDFPVQQIQVSELAGICAFRFFGFEKTVYRSHSVNEPASWAPAQIFDVQCGLSQADIPPFAVGKPSFRLRRSQFKSPVEVQTSEDPNCPASST